MLYRMGRDFFTRHPRLLSGPLGGLARWVPQGIRYGVEFRRMRRRLAGSQWWNAERLAAYQLEKLRETLKWSYAEIPYHRERFDAAGVSPDDLRSLEDLRRFPTIDKQVLRRDVERLHAPGFDPNVLMKFITGGTTGSGVMLRFEESFRQREQAFIWRLWNIAGYRQGMLAATLQYRECPEDVNDGIWYMDRASNAMVMSAHRLSKATIGRYLDAFDRRRPQVFITYPSLANLFATYAKEVGWKATSIRVVLCSSENLYDFQRRHLEEVFQAPVRIHYGHLESAALFGYCELSDAFHVQTEYGHVEFLKPDGTEAEPGEAGEIVATSFDNRSIPMVRFRTQDWAELGEGPCECGRAFPLVRKIQGREGHFVRTPSGKLHSPVLIEFLMDAMVIEGYGGFEDLQIMQDRVDEVVVKVVPASSFTTQELEHFCQLLSVELDGEVRVRSELVESIPRTERQKKSLIVSRVNSDALPSG